MMIVRDLPVWSGTLRLLKNPHRGIRHQLRLRHFCKIGLAEILRFSIFQLPPLKASSLVEALQSSTLFHLSNLENPRSPLKLLTQRSLKQTKIIADFILPRMTRESNSGSELSFVAGKYWIAAMSSHGSEEAVFCQQ